MQKIVWHNKVEKILKNKGRDFARIKTPRGWRSLTKKHLLPEGRNRIEGSCFHISIKLAIAFPEDYWYCEGLAQGMPHAWVALKEFNDADWCLDLTWPFYTLREGYREHDYFHYKGVRFDISDVKSFMLNRLNKFGEGSTSLSMLKYPDEIVNLIQ